MSWIESFVEIPQGAYSIAGCLVEPEAACQEVIVICGSLLDHRKHLYRDLVMLARALAQTGIATLRFDYGGFGESAGQAERADLGTFVADAEASVRWLRAARPGISIRCIGVGLGAIIAAHTVSRMGPMPLIALQPLWQVELLQHWPLRGKQRYAGQTVDANGYCISQHLYKQLASNEWQRDFPRTPFVACTALVMHVQDGPSVDAARMYRHLLERSGLAVVVRSFQAGRFWLSAELALPVAEVCNGIHEWLQKYD